MTALRSPWHVRTVALAVALIIGGVSPASTETPRWPWPTDPRGVVVRPFIAPATPYGPGHRGVDLAAEPGTEVLAVADSTVHFVGVVVDRPVITLRLGDGTLVSYEPVASDLSVDDRVAARQPIGSLIAGHCARGCLHLGVRVEGQYRNPLLWLEDVPPSILLPTRRSGDETIRHRGRRTTPAGAPDGTTRAASPY